MKRYGKARTLGILLACGGLLSACESDSPDYNNQSATTNQTANTSDSDGDNDGGRRSSVHMSLSRDRGAQRTVNLSAGTYEATLECTNDGDSDLITVSVDGRTVLAYTTRENRMGGNGWYVSQGATSSPFNLPGGKVEIKVGVRAGRDGYGVWPQNLWIRKAD
jgi:hypothetical protein